MPQVIVSTKSPRAGSSVPSPGGSRVRTPQARPQGGPIPQISIADATAAERGKAAAAESLGKAGVDLTNFGVKLLKAKNDLVAATEVIRLKGDAAGSLQKLTFDLENRQPGEQDILGHEELMIQGIQDTKVDLLGRAKTQEGKAAVEAYFLREEPRMVIASRVFELKREADIGRAGLAVAIDAAKERAVRATGQEFDKEIGFIRSSYDGALKARIITAEAHQKGIKKAGNDIALGKTLIRIPIEPERVIKDIQEGKLHFEDLTTRARMLALAIKAKETRETELDRIATRKERKEEKETKERRETNGAMAVGKALAGEITIPTLDALHDERLISNASFTAAKRILVREESGGNESRAIDMKLEAYNGKFFTQTELDNAQVGEDGISKKETLAIRALQESLKKGDPKAFQNDPTFREQVRNVQRSLPSKDFIGFNPNFQRIQAKALEELHDRARAGEDFLKAGREVIEKWSRAHEEVEPFDAKTLKAVLQPWIDRNAADPKRPILKDLDNKLITRTVAAQLLRQAKALRRLEENAEKRKAKNR